MLSFTIQEILAITGGTFIDNSGEATDIGASVNGVSTDTRNLKLGDLFVALVGDRFNGHEFCVAAMDLGAALLLVSDETKLPPKSKAIMVADTLKALQSLAGAYRQKLNCKVIAVTGSVGKTSTREMIQTVLSPTFKTHCTTANNNNEIGLPLTILSAPADTQVLIVEMGMRLPGEILELTLIAKPDIGVITNVGMAHIERLGSREGILSAKMEICQGLQGDKWLIIDGEDPLLRQATLTAEPGTWDHLGMVFLGGVPKEGTNAHRLVAAEAMETQGVQTSFGIISQVNNHLEEQATCLALGNFLLHCVGAHHVQNALFATICGLLLGLNEQDIRSALLNFEPGKGRGKMIQTKHYVLFDDSYNASTQSMLAAFESLRLAAGENRKIAALGCMLELGEYAKDEHFKVGAAAAKSGIDRLFVCGEQGNFVKAGALSVNPDLSVSLFSDREKLQQALLMELLPQDTILVKGSLAFGMSKIVESILEMEAMK